MGSGKTAVGRGLAKALGYNFVDADQELEQQLGVSISDVFHIEGEAGFRKREAKVIDSLTQKSDIVLAAGGGVVLNPDNRNHLTARGTVIYLAASIETLLQRTQYDNRRPLLADVNRKETLANLLQQRDPLYRELADHIIETDGLSIKDCVKKLLSHLRNDFDTL